MGLDIYIQLTIRALLLVLYLSGPAIIVAVVVGVSVSLFQAVTQIQDQTLSIAIKLFAVTITLIGTGFWMRSTILAFAHELFGSIRYLAR